jgi:hypothetical protein
MILLTGHLLLTGKAIFSDIILEVNLILDDGSNLLTEDNSTIIVE